MNKLFDKILIANRGEVAVRIIKACKALHIATVAVYSDADKHSPHVNLADEAVHIGPSQATESYLSQDKVLEAAKLTNADAIHPGFGFLSENAGFAQKCTDAQIKFIGPSPDAMTLMASKSASKNLIESLKLPVIPGYQGDDQTLETLSEAANSVGFPLLIKASAGGGGMGMRVVNSADQFEEALKAAKSEAASAFGDDQVLIEKYFDNVRHIEVQVLADEHGKVLHAFERECSIQRRRQKVVEEAPSPSISTTLREQITKAAVNIAEAVNYQGLGTVEFMVEEGTDNFYFLEMNTRLQVEHGITEAITGLDLVQLQIQIAESQPLSLSQNDIQINGHAIECRLYAEDANQNFAPSTGHIHYWQPYTEQSNSSIRTDSGICSGIEVSSYYDPMLAKLISHGASRELATRYMCRHLENTKILGVTNNQVFLKNVLLHPEFIAANTPTSFIEQYKDVLNPVLAEEDTEQLLIVAAIQRAYAQELGQKTHAPQKRQYLLSLNEEAYSLNVQHTSAHGYHVEIGDKHLDVEVLANKELHHHAHELRLVIEGVSQTYTTVFEKSGIFIHTSNLGSTYIDYLSRFSRKESDTDGAGYQAAMPGRIIEVFVEPGSLVKEGDKLLTMESMKMEHSTLAKSDGKVTELLVTEGDTVNKGDTLIEIEATE